VYIREDSSSAHHVMNIIGSMDRVVYCSGQAGGLRSCWLAC